MGYSDILGASLVLSRWLANPDITRGELEFIPGIAPDSTQAQEKLSDEVIAALKGKLEREAPTVYRNLFGSVESGTFVP